MTSKTVVWLCWVLLGYTVTSNATTIQYAIEADDYAMVYVDGQPIISYDEWGNGTRTSLPLELSDGWHSLVIEYMNRRGSNRLALGWMNQGAWAGVLLENMRSRNAVGDWIPGLRAEYHDELSFTSSPVLTVYGEGPIDHGWIWGDQYPDLIPKYQGVTPAKWGGIYGGWSCFAERLSGEVLVTPEPVGASLLTIGGLVLLGQRRQARMRASHWR